MAQTASGFLRVAALLMTTAVFAAVWSGDQQTQHEFLIARKSAAQRVPGVLLSQDHAPVPRRAQLTPHRSDDVAPTLAAIGRSSQARRPAAKESYVTRVEIEMRLPAGIVAGRYQVVDQTGATQIIRVAASDATPRTQEIYRLDQPDGGSRFFIRLRETAAEPGELTQR